MLYFIKKDGFSIYPLSKLFLDCLVLTMNSVPLHCHKTATKL